MLPPTIFGVACKLYFHTNLPIFGSCMHPKAQINRKHHQVGQLGSKKFLMLCAFINMVPSPLLIGAPRAGHVLIETNPRLVPT